MQGEKMKELKKPDLEKPAFKIFKNTTYKISLGYCPMCSKKITKFKDKLSEKEYSISGMCQNCQDKVFK